MLGCHRTREVALVLQNGLRFRFRESQDLSIIRQKELCWPPELRGGDSGVIGDEITVRATLFATLGRSFHLADKFHGAPRVTSD